MIHLPIEPSSASGLLRCVERSPAPSQLTAHTLFLLPPCTRARHASCASPTVRLDRQELIHSLEKVSADHCNILETTVQHLQDDWSKRLSTGVFYLFFEQLGPSQMWSEKWIVGTVSGAFDGPLTKTVYYLGLTLLIRIKGRQQYSLQRMSNNLRLDISHILISLRETSEQILISHPDKHWRWPCCD